MGINIHVKSHIHVKSCIKILFFMLALAKVIVTLREKVRISQNERFQRRHKGKVENMECVLSSSQPDHAPALTLLLPTCKRTLGKCTHLINEVFPSPFIHSPMPSLASCQSENSSELFVQNSHPLFLQDGKTCSVPEPQRKNNCAWAEPPLHWQPLFCIWALIHNQTLMNHAILLKSTVLKSTI